jgi:hypothetical protein
MGRTLDFADGGCARMVSGRLNSGNARDGKLCDGCPPAGELDIGAADGRVRGMDAEVAAYPDDGRETASPTEEMPV